MNSPRVRVSLDGFFLSQPATGSGQYTLHLWRHLSRSHDEAEVFLLRPAALSGERSHDDNVFEVRPIGVARNPKAFKLWWEQVGMPTAMRRSGSDLLHVPYLSAPRFNRFRTIVTIHDVIPLLFPEYGGSTAMKLYLRLVLPAVRRSSLILTDSDCSKRDIVRLLHVEPSNVRTVPLAASDDFRPEPASEAMNALRDQFDLPGPVIFNVGGLDVRKNITMLVEAFGRALPSLDPNTRLVIGGTAHTGNSRLYPPIEPVVRTFGLDGTVRLVGRITDEEKRLLYQLSDLYAYPSLYEGFGLTPLEAMACGLPVVASNRSSLPEVVGTGGLLVDPTPARFAAAMISVLTDEHLRRDLSQRALDQASHFGWDKTADQTRTAYLETVGTRHS